MSNMCKRVDNGIIISSNVYSNFQSISKETPMALMRVRGEVLIERQIESLIDAGITDITIVIGAGVEDFEYLVDKYDVDLVHMVEDLRGTLAPLYYVRNRLKNSYILNSTDYIQDDLYSKEETDSWHCIIETNKYTKEKVVEVSEDNRITKIKNGGYKCSFLYGSAFFNEEFSKKMKDFLEEYYQDKSRRYLDWEDILLHHIDELEIYANKREYESIYAFNSKDELQRLDINHKEDKRKLVDMIANILEVKNRDVSNVIKMGHGMTNDSMLFECEECEYIIRIPGMGTDNLINRQNEYINYRTVEKLDISDKVVYMNKESGVKITEFERGSRILDLKSEDEIEQAFAIVRKLHNSGLTVPHKFGLKERLVFYEKLCREQNVVFFDGFEEVKKMNYKHMEELSNMDIKQTFCHIDPVDENFLVLEDGGMILIDWEYSSMADPLIDLAMFSIHGGLSKDEVERVMEIYFEREPTDNERLRVYYYVSICGFLWYLWAEYKGSLGQDFEEYKKDMYDIAKNFYKEIL